jgi:L-ascorbate metabolism protein UlaG (beta-lactamase superfamily)
MTRYLLAFVGVASLAVVLSADAFGDIQITPLVHSSVQIEYAGKVIQIDPWSRADLSKAKPADLILITDDPIHHLDPKAIAQLRKPGAPIVIPAGIRAAGRSNAMKQLPDGIALANGESQTVAGILIHAIAAYDLTTGDPYHPKGEANGYVITLGNSQLYFAGVTQCVPEIRALKNIAVAFFPMNLPLNRMEPDAAVECLRVIKPKVVYPYHYDQAWVATRADAQRPVPTTKGLVELRTALQKDGIDVRLANWYLQ